VDLPVKDLYALPLNIRVFDNRKFGRKPHVGSAVCFLLVSDQNR
jgi:hypothetical protein